jgi:hypothetical protein
MEEDAQKRKRLRRIPAPVGADGTKARWRYMDEDVGEGKEETETRQDGTS